MTLEPKLKYNSGSRQRKNVTSCFFFFTCVSINYHLRIIIVIIVVVIIITTTTNYTTFPSFLCNYKPDFAFNTVITLFICIKVTVFLLLPKSVSKQINSHMTSSLVKVYTSKLSSVVFHSLVIYLIPVHYTFSYKKAENQQATVQSRTLHQSPELFPCQQDFMCKSKCKSCKSSFITPGLNCWKCKLSPVRDPQSELWV